MKAELQLAIDDHPRRACIHWDARYIEESEVGAVFRDADILVLPYRRIDQSGVLMQAFRWGIPVVASRVGAFEDYVSPDRGELCAADDPASLHAALERAVARDGGFDRTALQRAAAALDWACTVGTLRTAYGRARSASAACQPLDVQ